MSKNILFVSQQAPYGTVFSQEKLQMAMVFGAFELNVSMLFLGNGVFSLMKNQQPDTIGFYNFSRQYRALEQYYDIRDIYVDRASLEESELSQESLLIPVTVINYDEIQALLRKQDVILTN